MRQSGRNKECQSAMAVMVADEQIKTYRDGKNVPDGKQKRKGEMHMLWKGG